MIYDQISAAQRAKKLECDPFTYTATWIVLGVGATTPVNVPIQSDSDFVVVKSYLCCYTAANVFQVDPDMLVSFFDTGSGRAWQDAPVHVHNCMGIDAFHANIWSEPQLVKGASVITVTLQNLSGVAQGRVDVALQGFKIFYYPGFSRDAVGL